MQWLNEIFVDYFINEKDRPTQMSSNEILEINQKVNWTGFWHNAEQIRYIGGDFHKEKH